MSAVPSAAAPGTAPSSSSNHLFIKSVSPLATVQSVKDFFEQAPLEEDSSRTVADDVERIDFILYPESKQKYCQVTFRSSAGVTSAMTLNGHLLHGVPTPLSVIDPAQSSSSRLATGIASLNSLKPGGFSISPAAVQAFLFEQAGAPGGLEGSAQVATLKQLVSSAGLLTATQATQLITHAASHNPAEQAAPLRALISTLTRASAGDTLTQEMVELLTRFASHVTPGESEEHQIKRTLFVTNIPEEWDETKLMEVLTDELALGTVLDRRMDVLPRTGQRFALIEFTSEDAVTSACRLTEEQRTITVEEGRKASTEVTLEFEPARATVRPREPENVSFSLGTANVAPVPIAYQSINKLNLEEKLQRVRALADRLASRPKEERDQASSNTGGESRDEGGYSRRRRHHYHPDYDHYRPRRRRRYYREDF
eukprot:Blabericola_migrator_1__408@NODE_10_length_25093_cov_104_131184_g7_i2_p8_GENE_NODE_10_length_25093_cov_104_131184_g7_i2NODE_10_length_25093_cov_104_131184_g7_i2_p8_ORF_typecomplete_len426_score47_04RRM_1/PF00076_22/0_0017RRM_1/PF00076_22/0_0048RRM_Rrp7/PF17799_1/5_3RRM_Rrp7/PF17799_1/0_0026ZFYVE21_C/PF16696_5/0_0052RL/PF17797_1/3_9e03RL/PF17797_1/0_12RL/PF17797_1/2_3e03RRM_2/PF04059_12/0_06PHM7_cyt/PF14703_6/0_14_NODE_10_length_25093_cov_104_131184_g7_i21607017347